jgi:pyruvate carboxylase
VRVGITEITAGERAALGASSLERRAMLNQLLFPAPTRQFQQVRESYGDLSVVDTVDYLYGLQQGQEHAVEIAKGVRLYVGLEAIGEADDKGMRTVMTILNGQLRPVFVRDTSITVQTKAAEKADANQPGQIAAPFSGVVTLQVEEGAHVEAGQSVASIEAMKMEAAITSPIAGTIERVAIPLTQQVDAGDLLVTVRPR